MMPLPDVALSVFVAWNTLVAEPQSIPLREIALRDTVSRVSVARGAVSRDTVSRDTVSRYTVSRDTVSRDTVPQDTVPTREASVVDSLPAPTPSRPSFDRLYPDTITTADTIRRARPRAVAYSDAYGTRLTLHRRLSWAMLPLFALSYFSGDQILEKSSEAPAWARNLHRPAATGSAVLFAANSVTGYWNLWEGRHDPNHRKRRVLHAVLFTTASAGFVYAGTQLAEDAEQSQSKRRQHRNVALGSIGLSTGSWLLMLLGN